jgi:catechol 2,3-dioxygenase-like lactoylglutathione lyase family enzyme
MTVTDFPPLTHDALTVRDLSVSVPWYEALLDAKPVLDEDTDPDFHHTVYLRSASASSGSAWTTSPSAAPTGRSWRSGRGGWTSWASLTARSSTAATARA